MDPASVDVIADLMIWTKSGRSLFASRAAKREYPPIGVYLGIVPLTQCFVDLLLKEIVSPQVKSNFYNNFNTEVHRNEMNQRCMAYLWCIRLIPVRPKSGKVKESAVCCVCAFVLWFVGFACQQGNVCMLPCLQRKRSGSGGGAQTRCW